LLLFIRKLYNKTEASHGTPVYREHFGNQPT